MKVTIVASGLHPAGGVERYTLEVLRGLAARHHSVTAVIPERDRTHLPLGVSTQLVGTGRSPVSWLGAAATLGYCWRSRSPARRAGGVPYGPLGSLKTGVITAHSIHRVAVSRTGRDAGGISTRLFDAGLHASQRAGARGSEVLLNAVSPSCAAQLAATFSIDPGTIRVIPPAIDPATFHPASPAERAAERARLAIPTGCPAIAVAANHAFGAKRVADLIVVAGRLGAHLLVCGVADRRLSDYQALAAHNGAAVSFLGAMSDMRAVYVAADVVALVSDYESYGMSVHEAMACGTPTVVSRGCGIADLVTDCKAVRLVDARDVDQISQSVAELLEPEVAQRVAAAGAAWARRRTWDDVVTEVEAELKRFAAGARTSSGS